MTLPAIVAGHTTAQDVSAATTRDITTPTHASGDMILIFTVDSIASGNVGISGFNKFYDQVSIGFASGLCLFYKIAGGGEPANYTITSASAIVSAIAVAVSGGKGFHALGTNATGSSGTATAPAVTTILSDCLRISVIAADDSPGITSVATLATHNLLATVTGAGKPTVSVQWKNLAAAGTDVSQTAALSGTEAWLGVTFAISELAEARITKAGAYLDILDSQVNVTKAGAYLEIVNNQMRVTKAGVYLEFTEPFPTPPAPTSRPWFAVVMG